MERHRIFAQYAPPCRNSRDRERWTSGSPPFVSLDKGFRQKRDVPIASFYGLDFHRFRRDLHFSTGPAGGQMHMGKRNEGCFKVAPLRAHRTQTSWASRIEWNTMSKIVQKVCHISRPDVPFVTRISIKSPAKGTTLWGNGVDEGIALAHPGIFPGRPNLTTPGKNSCISTANVLQWP